MALAARLPVHPNLYGLLVDASFNGKPAQMLFDTGAIASFLTPGAVSRLGLWRIRLQTD